LKNPQYIFNPVSGVRVKKVFLDTNFVIDVVRFKQNLDSIDPLTGPHKFIVLSSVVNELEKISKTKKSVGKYALLSLNFVKKFSIQKSEKRNADSDIISNADENSIVATNDKNLRKLLKDKGIKTIYLRAKKHLAIG